MLVLQAYYDGSTVKTVEDYKFTKDQKLTITVLDEAQEDKADGLKSLRGSLSKYASKRLMKKENAAWAEPAAKKNKADKKAISRFFETADSLHLNSDGQKWTREELYER